MPRGCSLHDAHAVQRVAAMAHLQVARMEPESPNKVAAVSGQHGTYLC